MNQPIMRRGLCPDGKIIRQNHESSLLNDEFGVTSQYKYRGSEESSVENVLQIKRLKPRSKGHRSSDLDPTSPFYINKEIIIEDVLANGKDIKTDKDISTNGKHETAYLDNIINDSSSQNIPLVKRPKSSDVIVDSHGNNEEKGSQNTLDFLPEKLSTLTLNSDIFHNDKNFLQVHSENEQHSDNVNKRLTMNKEDSNNHVNNVSKIGSILEQLKRRKPACDSDTRNIWQNIEKQHRVLFDYDDNMSEYICATQRSKCNTPIKNKLQSSKLNNCSTLPNCSKDKKSVQRFYNYLSQPSTVKSQENLCSARPISEASNCSSAENFTQEIGAHSCNSTIRKKIPAPICKENALTRHRTMFLRSKSSGNLHIPGDPPTSYKRGKVPKYLLARKAEKQRQLEAASAIDPNCPPGHSTLPDHERINTLQLLKKGQVEALMQLSALPLVQESPSIRKRKKELNDKLNQIEEGIQIFSQKKVYVLNTE